MEELALVNTLYSQFSVVSGTAMLLRSRVVGKLGASNIDITTPRATASSDSATPQDPFSSFSRWFVVSACNQVYDELTEMLVILIHYASTSVCLLCFIATSNPYALSYIIQ